MSDWLQELLERARQSQPVQAIREVITGRPTVAPTGTSLESGLEDFKKAAVAPLMLPLRYAQGVGDMAQQGYDWAKSKLSPLEQELAKRLGR